MRRPDVIVPWLSIVVPTCSRPAELELCLTRLVHELRQMPAGIVEIIVSDDSKTACNQRLHAHFPEVMWVEGPRRGPASNRNRGAERANGKWLLFVDDDCIPFHEFLGTYIKLSQKTRELVIEGKTISRAGLSARETAPANLSGGYMWSCNFAVNRDLFVEMGGFDERIEYPHMEDVDFRWRLEKRNVPWVFCPDAVVFHPPRALGSIWGGAWHFEVHYYLARKHDTSVSHTGINLEVILRRYWHMFLRADTFQEMAETGCRLLFTLFWLSILVPAWYLKWKYVKI